jgi:DHA2 family multidrug resistance protein-like MFS transporter
MGILVPRKWWALGAVSLVVVAVGLDGTLLSVALPTLSNVLHASESDLQWFSSGYFLVLAAAMLPAGLLGDRSGHKKVLLIALGLLGLGSAACAYSTSVGAFMAARVLLGLAGAGVIVMAISSLTVLFSKAERPKAVGIWAASNFLALPLGPILGGWLLTHYWWGWVFLINVPVAALGVAATAALVPESRATERPGLDPLGVATSAAGLVAVTYGLIKAGQNGWGDVGAVLLMIVGVALLVGFFMCERLLLRRPGGQPLLDLTLFRSASFTWGAILAAVALLAMVGVLFTMAQYFQGVHGTDAMGSGLRLLPLIGWLVIGAVPPIWSFGWWAPRSRSRPASSCLPAGCPSQPRRAQARATSSSPGGWRSPGRAWGWPWLTASSAALVELSEERSGVGSAVLQAANKVGGPFGTAILGSVLSSVYLARLDVSRLPASAVAAVRQSIFDAVAVAHKVGSAPLLESVRTAFVHGMDTALVVSAGIALAGAVLTLLYLPATNATMQACTAREGEVVGTQ